MSSPSNHTSSTCIANERRLKESVAKAIYDVLMELCGGEDNEEEETSVGNDSSSSNNNNTWRRAIAEVAKSGISFPNHRNSKQSHFSGEGKPHDVEIRAALTLFHRFKQKRTGTKTENDINNNNNNAVLTVTSKLGLQKTFQKPQQFAQAICPLLEEHCSATGVCHHIQCSSSGIICIVTPFRAEIMRKAGKLPCPQCIQWCKGEKGLWWHQQQKHGSEHSVATATAASQKNVFALVPYQNPILVWTTEQQQQQEYYSATSSKAQNPTASDDDPLEYVKNGDLETVKKLVVEGGYDPANAWDRKGASPLMWAAGAGHLSLVKYLIEQCQCCPHQGQRGKRSFAGRTPLHWASRNGHISVVKYLVEFCQVSLEATTIDGTTAFAWASWQAHLDVMKYLFEQGANVHKTNSFGCNAVLWCAQGKGTCKTMKWLQSIGCDIFLVNCNGHSVLHKASQRGNKDIIEWMVECLSPSVIQSGNSNKDQKFLLESCLQLIGPDSDGCSPSDLAGMEGHDDLAAWIVSQERRLLESVLESSLDDTTKLPHWLVPAKDTNPNTICYSSYALLWEPWAGVNRMKGSILSSKKYSFFA